jgi:hypothetical protein
MHWTPKYSRQSSRIKVRVWGYLENLFLKDPAFDLGHNFRIRRTFETERRQLYAWDGRVPDQGLPKDSIDSLSIVAETAIETEWSFLPTFLTKEVQEANSRLLSLPRALILFLDKIVKMKTVEPQQGDISEIGPPAKFLPPRWAQSLYTKYRDPAVMGIKELETFKKFFWDYATLEKPGFVLRAIGRFGWASDMAGELENIDYRFVDYVRSLEALLGSGTEIAHRLASRTAALLGGSPADRQDTYDFIKASYRCRSGSVHGEGLPQLEFGRWLGTKLGLGMMENVDLLHWYCRRSVRRVVDLISAINKNEIVAAKWKGIEDKEKKAWITRLLDYSLLRCDISDALQKFYEDSADIEPLWTLYEKIMETPFNPSGKHLPEPPLTRS